MLDVNSKKLFCLPSVRHFVARRFLIFDPSTNIAKKWVGMDNDINSPLSSNSKTPSSVSAFANWDRHFSQEELQAIDAAFHSATSSSTTSSSSSSSSRYKKHCLSATVGISYDDSGATLHQDRRKSFRRLPGSFSLSPCPRSRLSDHCHSSHQGSPSTSTMIMTPTLAPSIIKYQNQDHCQSFQRLSDPCSPTPCLGRQFYSHYHSTCRAEALRYPTMMFKGRIIYGRTTSEVEKASEELIKFVEAKKGEGVPVILGFDIEWKPTFKSGIPPGKAAVIQICADGNHCYILHIIHSGIPWNLQFLLEDSTSIKVGVFVMNDASKISKDYNVLVKDLEDLSVLANQKLGGEPKNWSLASLIETLICKQLPKPAKIRLGNWEADVLSKEQLKYAATDAYASWYIYQVLKGFADTTQENGQKVEQNSAS